MMSGALRRAISGVLIALGIAGGASAAADRAGPATMGPINSVITGDLVPTHDPVIAREGDTYYVFGTGKTPDTAPEPGRSVLVRTSPDLIHWTAKGGLFAGLPAWVQQAVPGARDMWAPDISYWGGAWHLYYAVSTFGSNRSAIGLFTSPTLDPASPRYKWTDRGMVVQSTPASDFNAIDPNHVIDREGRHWLALGSFWTGLKLFRLDPVSGKPLDPAAAPVSIARRPAPQGAPDPVEAPFIIAHGPYYYLLASYDYCCKGVNSTYYTVVGRSTAITGPYLGRDGSSMMNGGGTIILRADLKEQERFRGPGHAGFLHDTDGRDYLVYHAYDRQNHGAPTLRISPIRWTADGWPEAVQ